MVTRPRPARRGLLGPCARGRPGASRPVLTSSGDLPRIFATSSGRRRPRRPAIVARDTLIAFAEPSDFASTSCTPAASRIARAAPPAMTPVPGAAGFSSTRAASCSPRIWWVIVEPASGTGEEVLLRLFHALLDRGRHFLGLAVAEADVAVAVADDDERGEGEPPTTLDHLGDAVDRDDPLFVLAFGHVDNSPRLLELEARAAGTVGDRGDATVVLEPAAVEHDRVDAGALRPLAETLADGLGRGDGRAGCRSGAFSIVDADASVRPATSSITCA